MKNIYFFGCYCKSYNKGANIGDYMYKEIFEHYFKDYKIVLDHKNHIQRYTNIIDSNDIVVIGGGGLLYERAENIKYFMYIYKLHLVKKFKYILFSIGIQPDCFTINETYKLENSKVMGSYIPFIRSAYKIYARSHYDRDVFLQYNNNTIYYPDLCFSLYKIRFLKPKTKNLKKKNIITIGSMTSLKPHIVILRQLIDIGFKHYHLIFSKGDIFEDSQWNIVRNNYRPEIMYKPSIKYYQNVYEQASYVYTSRFHGMLFAELCNVEHIIPLLPTYKIVNYNNYDEDESVKSLEDLKLVLRKLINT